MNQSIGILGLGVYLPPQVRKNDWWPPEIVEQWREKARRAAGHRGAEDLTTKTEGERLVYAALAELDDDPFKGARERRIADENMSAADLEVFAAQEALRDADIPPRAVDLLLTHSIVPDYLATNHACTIHRRVGLPQRCFTLSVEGACNSFLLQMTLAQRLIQAGEARFALLVQSSVLPRMIPREESYSPWFGEGATAVIVGPVCNGRGLLGRSHRTDGNLENTMVTGIPGKRWYEDGHNYLYSENPAGAHRMFETVADSGRQVANEALAEAGLQTTDVPRLTPVYAPGFYRPGEQNRSGASAFDQPVAEVHRGGGVGTVAVGADLVGEFPADRGAADYDPG